jgi:hypothetical protein
VRDFQLIKSSFLSIYKPMASKNMGTLHGGRFVSNDIADLQRRIRIVEHSLSMSGQLITHSETNKFARVSIEILGIVSNGVALMKRVRQALENQEADNTQAVAQEIVKNLESSDRVLWESLIKLTSEHTPEEFQDLYDRYYKKVEINLFGEDEKDTSLDLEEGEIATDLPKEQNSQGPLSSAIAATAKVSILILK